jgi:hypothetical protein
MFGTTGIYALTLLASMVAGQDGKLDNTLGDVLKRMG